MKVLQINATYGYKSTGLIMKDIGDMLTQSGEQAYFAYQSAKGPVQNGFVVGNKLDWKAHALLCRLIGRQGYYSKRPTKKFLKTLDKLAPDVVHLHNLHSNFIHLNLLLAHLAKKDIPTVITMHDCWYFTGKCFHFADVLCDKFEKDCKKCPKRMSPPASVFFDRASSVLRERKKHLEAIPRLRIVGCSQWICQQAKRGIMKDLNVCTVYNGVDTSVFYPRDKQESKKTFGLENKFVIMGMANKWLNPHNKLFFEAMLEKVDKNSKILLVGCNGTQMKDLEKYKDKILATGFVHDRTLLSEYYSAADVFVNVTHADTLPTVNMESILCNTPVVTYDSCGSPEVVPEGCGYVVEEDDYEKLIQRILEIRDGKSFACGEIGRAKFDKKQCYRKYLDIYRELTKKEDIK